MNVTNPNIFLSNQEPYSPSITFVNGKQNCQIHVNFCFGRIVFLLNSIIYACGNKCSGSYVVFFKAIQGKTIGVVCVCVGGPMGGLPTIWIAHEKSIQWIHIISGNQLNNLPGVGTKGSRPHSSQVLLSPAGNDSACAGGNWGSGKVVISIDCSVNPPASSVDKFLQHQALQFLHLLPKLAQFPMVVSDPVIQAMECWYGIFQL